MTINLKQAVSIFAAVLGVLVISTAQLTEVFGPTMAKSIVSVSALLSAILNGINVALTSQTATVSDAAAIVKTGDASALREMAPAVASTKGVEIQISKDAPASVAALAISNDDNSIVAKPGQEAAVADVASRG